MEVGSGGLGEGTTALTVREETYLPTQKTIFHVTVISP